MLHVILTILAVIGIIILSVIGLLLLVAALVLFWPVKYRVNASYFEKKYSLKVKVWWLLGIICDRMTLDNDGTDNSLKIFGREFGDEKPEKKKPAKKKPDNNKVATTQERPVIKEPESVPEKVPDRPAVAKEPEVLKRIREEKAQEEEKPQKEKVSIWQRIKAFFTKLKSRFKTISEIITDENNKASLRFIKRQLFTLLKKIRPRKVKADIDFGLGDPALTGQALGGIAVVMGIVGRGFEIRPDFENKIIQGELELRGRIFIFSLLIIALRVYRNKNLRRSYKKLQKVKF